MESTITGIAHLQIELQRILDATNNFAIKNIIGKGGLGNVYKGKLEHNGKMIKIVARRLDRKYGLGDVEFWTEVSVLSSLPKTDRIVNMIGFCDEKGEKVIVNEHCAKGSLLMHINKPTLTWKQRFAIIEMLCVGIEDIHEGLGSDYIIHRNINSSTILLDKNWLPKLSGFEFSIKHSVERRNQVVLSVAIGTKGYIDPSIEEYRGVTHKSDIYSLGVVLFELLCGRKAFEENKLLTTLVKMHYENGTLKDIIHPDLWSQMDPESFKYLSRVVYSCLEEEPALRPDAEQLSSDVMMAEVFLFETVETDDQYHENDNEGQEGKKGEEDVCKNMIQKLEDVLERSSDPWKVKKWEHLRIWLTDMYDSSNIRHSSESSIRKGRDILLVKEIECYDRENVSSLNNKDKVPKIRYRVTMKVVEYREDVSLREIGILSKCKHPNIPNIQSLFGFYDQDSVIMIFYEHVSLRYLYEILNDGNLNWGKCLKICIDVAHGLDYLHSEMEDRKMIIHGDINSRNIELDEISGAKIVGFENSLIMDLNEDDESLQLDDIALNKYYNKYYTDPEYALTGKIRRESDVFSLGVIMFEILSGKCGYDLIDFHGGKDKGLVPLARQWFDEGSIKKNLSPRIKEEYYGNSKFLNKGPNQDSLDTFIGITYQCLAESHTQRPDMKLVIKELQKALTFHENHKDPLRMSFDDVRLATQDFDSANCIGGGGFGLVYKGKLEHGKDNVQSTIVAKKLDKSQGQGEKQYYNELQILYEYHNENIIGLVGYSNETDEKLIVYEHASKGSLDNHLHNKSLKWRNRLKICIDVANGLNFLHGGICEKGVVIHRDIKTANILLFDDWKAKIGDFGLSLISIINKETKFTIDHPCGTRDYVDPMYLKSGILTVESDVYSFGVALFEILCGRPTYKIPKDEHATAQFH